MAECFTPTAKSFTSGSADDVGSNPLRLSFLFKCRGSSAQSDRDRSSTVKETLKWLKPLPILMQESFSLVLTVMRQVQSPSTGISVPTSSSPETESSALNKLNERTNEPHNNNDNVPLSCAHQRPDCSHGTYSPKYNILYTRRAQSYQNNLRKVLYAHTHTHTMTIAEIGY